MNAVQKRIWELARFELGRGKKFIGKVARKEIIPDKRYAWLLYSKDTESGPEETVVLDVSLAEALAIDKELGVEVRQISKSSKQRAITVLLADDHTVVRQGLRSLLEAENDIRVVGEAKNGREAVQMTVRLEPDVVVMDVAMPLLNGLEAVRQIKAQSLNTKILILSCHLDDGYVKGTIDAGVTGYLLKQTAAQDVITAIREAKQGNAFFSPIISKRLIEFQRQAANSGGSVTKEFDRLTPVESEVLELVVEGYPSKRIAAKLSISDREVEKHRRRIRDKLDIHNVAGLTRYAIVNGIIEDPKLKVKNCPTP